MSKIKVKLNCQWDNGEVVLSPGTETELERDQAFKLADLGMVEVLRSKKSVTPPQPSTAGKGEGKGKGKGKAGKGKTESGPAPDGDPDDDDDPEGGKDDLSDPDKMTEN